MGQPGIRRARGSQVRLLLAQHEPALRVRERRPLEGPGREVRAVRSRGGGAAERGISFRENLSTLRGSYVSTKRAAETVIESEEDAPIPKASGVFGSVLTHPRKHLNCLYTP